MMAATVVTTIPPSQYAPVFISTLAGGFGTEMVEKGK